MQPLTEAGRQTVNNLAQRHGFSPDAVTSMLYAVAAGYGNQAQFNHPEFGGMGQWSSGGMVMIGDMFNNNLKGRVSSLCQELAGLIQGQPMFEIPAQSQSQSQGGGWQGQGNFGGQQQSNYGGQQQSQGGSSGSSLFVAGGYWWPADLGQPSSSGAQNNMRYAYFPAMRRLAIDVNGQISVYDTGNHQIGGFGQQQSGDQSLTFTSQFGLVRVMDLPIVSGAPIILPANAKAAPSTPPPQFTQQPMLAAPTPSQPAADVGPAPTPPQPLPQMTPVAVTIGPAPHASSNEIIALLEKLAELRDKNIISDAEFETKKQDLLKRL